MTSLQKDNTGIEQPRVERDSRLTEVPAAPVASSWQMPSTFWQPGTEVLEQKSNPYRVVKKGGSKAGRY